MLRRLSIKNLLLVSECQLGFDEGFTVITGESGAGKSVVLSALQLILGQKADISHIRSGQDVASVEATFDPIPAGAIALLEEASIPYNADEELILCRELFRSGKSKSFVNNRAVTATFLKRLAPFLVSFCGQHAQMDLFDPDYARSLVDRFSTLDNELSCYQKLFSLRRDTQKKIFQIEQSKNDREVLLEIATHQINEIEALQLEAGEDESLYNEFCALQTKVELSDTIGEITEIIDNSVLGGMRQLRGHFEKLNESSFEMKTLSESYHRITVELKELLYELGKAQAMPDEFQMELSQLQDRLTTIDKIKKKFGKSIEEILAFKSERETTIKMIEDEASQLEMLKCKEEQLRHEEDALASSITKQRLKHAEILSEKITEELRSLNMPSCHFEMELEPIERTINGDERIVCYIQVNKGLPRSLVQDAASGGELSRLILACKSVLSECEESSCLVFDEIDANIGGQTAAIVGKKLSNLSKKRQVITITHFAQVASIALHHLVITKHENNEETFTKIQKLVTQDQRDEEFSRMAGSAVL